MSLYHGITVKDAATMCGVSESTVRNWFRRYNLPRTTDGQIDPFQLIEWWDNERDHEQARRRAPKAS